MFTGIIEEMGTIENIAKGAHSAVLTINARKILEEVTVRQTPFTAMLSDGHFL